MIEKGSLKLVEIKKDKIFYPKCLQKTKIMIHHRVWARSTGPEKGIPKESFSSNEKIFGENPSGPSLPLKSPKKLI
jgi:hypothetical protein